MNHDFSPEPAHSLGTSGVGTDAHGTDAGATANREGSGDLPSTDEGSTVQVTSSKLEAAEPATCNLQPATSIERVPSPLPARLPGTVALTEYHRRTQLLAAWDALKLADPALSYERGAKALGIPLATLWRLIKRREAGKSLVPDFHKAGRKPKHAHFATLLEIEGVRQKIDTLYVATFGASSESAASGRRTGKLSVAIARFAEEPECPPDLAEKLRTGFIPKPMVAYLRRITPEIEARFRGEKNFKLNGIVSRRDQTIRLPDGTRAHNVSGFLIEFDDMSVNQPFHVQLPDGTWLLSRQGLYARDVKSGRWLGVELVARPREAYRAEDILRFLRRLMMIYGKFDVIRLERGIWHARALKGWKVTPHGVEEEAIVRPDMAPEEQARLQAGLQAIGIHIQYVTSAHRKGALESSFNYLQTVLATYTTDLVNVGRYAGEFEAAAKRVRQARAESHTPDQLGFAPVDVLADRIEQAMAFINKRARGGDAANSADAIWLRDMAVRPLPPVTEIDLAAFLPEVRERAISGGRITVQVDGMVHDFRADLFARLGQGYRVFVRFDPGEPTLGAAIYNREQGSANTFELRQGDFICFARWEMPGPQIDLPEARGLAAVTTQALYGVGAEEDDGYQRRKNQEKFVRTAFRALPRPGQPAIKSAEVRDGHGNFARVADGSETPQLPSTLNSQSSQLPKRGLIPPPPTDEQFSRKRARLAEEAEAARALAGLQRNQQD